MVFTFLLNICTQLETSKPLNLLPVLYHLPNWKCVWLSVVKLCYVFPVISIKPVTPLRFLEAEYKVTFEFPSGLRQNRVRAKKSHDGWSKLGWVAADKKEVVVEKKLIMSQIAQIPSAGYLQRDNYSKASIQWLEYQMELARRKGEHLKIEHALNGGEAAIIGIQYKVDGRAGNTVHEYHGKHRRNCITESY